MRNILDIYNEYKIMPNLQMHQFRVAGVAMQICENMEKSGVVVDTMRVVTACLLHDMGNIIKSNLNYFPEFLVPEGFEYWQKVQNEYIEKYGKNEHQATLKILEELGVSTKVNEIVAQIGYPYIEMSCEDTDMHNKIAQYADLRVGPHGILSIPERAAEAKKRYEGRISDMNESEREHKIQNMFLLETQIFSQIKLTSGEINDDSVAAYIKKLQEFEL